MRLLFIGRFLLRAVCIVTFFIGVFRPEISFGQQWMVPVDSANNSILTNPHIQFEATEAIDDMYNFNFSRARSGFNALKKQYGWHPLPYFLLGLNYWWQIIPNISNTAYDDDFLTTMDTALVLSERLYEEVNEIEGAFFLAATHAFKGRLYSERRMYTKSAFSGRNTLKYLKEVRGYQDYSPEILFGDALFNYYAVWIRENYPFLRPLMAFFPRGDKDLGIAQLKDVANNAFYSRTEAQYYLGHSYFLLSAYEQSIRHFQNVLRQPTLPFYIERPEVEWNLLLNYVGSGNYEDDAFRSGIEKILRNPTHPRYRDAQLLDRRLQSFWRRLVPN